MELVLDGAQMSETAWREIYPPHVAECKQLPGTGLPFWHYDWSLCTSCKSPLNLCKHNPFGVDGEISRRRRERVLEASVASIAPPEVSEVIKPVSVAPESNKAPKRAIKPGDFIKGRRGRVKTTLVITSEIVSLAIAALSQGGTMTAYAQSQNLNPNELSVALKKAGFAIHKGPKGPRKGVVQ